MVLTSITGYQIIGEHIEWISNAMGDLVERIVVKEGWITLN